MTIKLINIVFDLGILYLIYLLSNKNVQKTFIYAINPVTLLITTLHGQFDVIPVFFILIEALTSLSLFNPHLQTYCLSDSSKQGLFFF